MGAPLRIGSRGVHMASEVASTVAAVAARIAFVFGLRVMRIIARIIFNFNNIRCV